MKRLFCAIAGALLLGSAPVLAADLGRAPVYKTPPAPYVPLNWTGCYIGGNLGGGWTHVSTDLGSDTISGFVGGGQIGCDYQFASNWVIGIQGLFDGADLSTNQDFGGFIGAGKLDWFATITGRLGYAVAPTFLLYFKGGAAFTHDNATRSNFATGSVSPTGWTIGGGGEWMFAPRWSVFVEYNYLDFGNNTITFSGGLPDDVGPQTATFKQNIQNVLVGVNYRFVP